MAILVIIFVSYKHSIEFEFACSPSLPREQFCFVQGIISQNFAVRHLLDGLSSFFILRRDFK